MLCTDRGHATVEVVHSIPLERIPERIVAQIVGMQVPQVVEKIIRVSEKSRNEWSTHSTNHRMSQDRIQQRTVEQVVNAQAQQVENPVEMKKHKIIKTKMQRRNPIILQVEISQIQRTQRSRRAETMDAATGTNVPEGAKDCRGARCDETHSSNHSNRTENGESATSSILRSNGGRSSLDTTTGGANDPAGKENICKVHRQNR